MKPWDHGEVRASANGRFLEHEDGTPFFWVGDTTWSIFQRTTGDEVRMLVQTRAEQGFNVLQCVALSELDGLRTPNIAGAVPLIDLDPTKPDLAGGYWDHVDAVFDAAEAAGLYIGLLPTWGDKVKANSWGDGPVVFNAENAYEYGKWLGSVYGARPNLIWINGGDRDPSGDESVWRAIARGIRDGEPHRNLMTFHPQGGMGSAQSFHTDTWLDLNMLQTGHGNSSLDYVSRMMDASYRRNPPKPVIDGEPRYENHPKDFNFRSGYFDSADVRNAVYTGLFAGGCGFTYGCHAVWQFAQDTFPPINNPISSWKHSLNLSGANQVRFVAQIMTELRYQEMSPARDQLRDGSGYQALMSSDAKRLAIYCHDGGEVGVREIWKSARWFDPRNGDVTPEFAVDSRTISPPPKGEERISDWILELSR